MTKVQLSLTDQEATILERYGSQFGYNLPKTIRFVISKASEEFLKAGAAPVFPMSQKTEAKGLAAVQEYRAGKTTEVKNAEEFFNQL